MKRWPRRAALLAAPVAALVAAVGCTVGYGVLQPGGKPAGVPNPTDPARGPGLFAVNSQGLDGPIVIDVQGYVLYRNDADGVNPSRPACVGECVKMWRPMPAGDIGRLRIVGIDRGKVGKIVRPDGIEQLTLAGWPLYGYAGDRMPGDVNGHGRDGWSVISPAGAKAGHPTP
ncbi:hypothetical protein [Streptosporangium sp. NBC_01756]|uniref:hypothetical protein n=1 Tax=Streptosporangium sp. NBC_01756 TaxID=2975950 RepID=UPI002DD9D856|nr:hypothetical protein [Streptosporangium sp. NBC_01756]WSC88366.1 hypothetical protein OIE48_09325 [Streptosporangium sp. NBC_01756]